jgi:hypothetical protein
VNHRRLTIPAAVVGCLGIALAPAFAEASTSSQSTAKHSTIGSALSPLKSGRYTFDSPLSKSVFHKTVAAHAATATAGTTGPNPDLAVAVEGDAVSSHGIEAEVVIGGLTTGTGTVTLSWGDGSTSYTDTVTGSTADGGVVPITDIPVHSYAALGTYALDVSVTDGAGDTATNAVNATTGSDFTPFGPARILDTRKDQGADGPVGPNKTAQLKVVGAQDAAGDTVPAGITAVVLNVTVTEEAGNGYLTVYGDDDANGDAQSNPGTSNLNFRTGQNIANLVTVPVGTDGTVDFFNGSSKGSTQVLADIAGYYTASSASSYAAIAPTRVLDTRKGQGAPKAQIQSDASIDVKVAGANGIPATATAVAVNLTAVDATKNGLITAYPTGQSRPGVSNVNYPASVATANMAIIPIGTGGQITFFNSSTGPTDLLADVSGYYTADSTVAGASAYIPFPAPQRLYDSRSNESDSLLSGALPYPSPLNTNTAYPIPLSSPDQPFTTGVFNATVVSPTGNGYLAFYPYAPSEPTKPSTSNLNYRTGQTIPNSVFVSPSSIEDANFQGFDGAVYFGGDGTAQVILDWFGVFAQ